MKFSNKRTYSINQACYLAAKNHEYIMGRDEHTGKLYWRFAESPEIQKDIYTYKTDEQLHKYLSQFYVMKQEMKEVRNNGML